MSDSRYGGPPTILWHPTRGFHYCVLDGDTVEYRSDGKREYAVCVSCGSALVVIATSSTNK